MPLRKVTYFRVVLFHSSVDIALKCLAAATGFLPPDTGLQFFVCGLIWSGFVPSGRNDWLHEISRRMGS
jgi:hypothetical protein